jgi:hypothetical protein
MLKSEMVFMKDVGLMSGVDDRGHECDDSGVQGSHICLPGLLHYICFMDLGLVLCIVNQ